MLYYRNIIPSLLIIPFCCLWTLAAGNAEYAPGPTAAVKPMLSLNYSVKAPAGNTSKAKQHKKGQLSAKALDWLKANQESNGSWSPHADQELVTALAMLAFLSRGETHMSERYGDAIARGLIWLVENEAQKCIGNKHAEKHSKNQIDPKENDHISISGMTKAEEAGSVKNKITSAVIAWTLSEYYRMTSLPFLKAPMEKSLARIISNQCPDGSFNYSNGSGTPDWQTQFNAVNFLALRAGYWAKADCASLLQSLQKAERFFVDPSLQNEQYAISEAIEQDAFAAAATYYLSALVAKNHSLRSQKIKGLFTDYQPEWQGCDTPLGISGEWYLMAMAKFYSGKDAYQQWDRKFGQLQVKYQQEDGHWNSPPNDRYAGHAAEPYLNTALQVLAFQPFAQVRMNRPPIKSFQNLSERIDIEFMD